VNKQEGRASSSAESSRRVSFADGAPLRQASDLRRATADDVDAETAEKQVCGDDIRNGQPDGQPRQVTGGQTDRQREVR
jgi:hypothetical protein